MIDPLGFDVGSLRNIRTLSETVDIWKAVVAQSTSTGFPSPADGSAGHDSVEP
jgi:hypothetical protein